MSWNGSRRRIAELLDRMVIEVRTTPGSPGATRLIVIGGIQLRYYPLTNRVGWSLPTRKDEVTKTEVIEYVYEKLS